MGANPLLPAAKTGWGARRTQRLRSRWWCPVACAAELFLRVASQNCERRAQPQSTPAHGSRVGNGRRMAVMLGGGVRCARGGLHRTPQRRVSARRRRRHRHQQQNGYITHFQHGNEQVRRGFPTPWNPSCAERRRPRAAQQQIYAHARSQMVKNGGKRQYVMLKDDFATVPLLEPCNGGFTAVQLQAARSDVASAGLAQCGPGQPEQGQSCGHIFASASKRGAVLLARQHEPLRSAPRRAAQRHQHRCACAVTTWMANRQHLGAPRRTPSEPP